MKILTVQIGTDTYQLVGVLRTVEGWLAREGKDDQNPSRVVFVPHALVTSETPDPPRGVGDMLT